ncbi:hypothetical protein [Aerococcus viridans]|uniref:hypothetical protein n=1 Tax=Aerococcus viridans TaxID=1377 RepID=UPI003B2195D1
MAKFKVLKDFKDIKNGKVYTKNDEIEMTVKRSAEVSDNLDDTYLERLDEPKTEK